MISYIKCSDNVDIQKVYNAFQVGFSDYIIKAEISKDDFVKRFFGPEGNDRAIKFYSNLGYEKIYSYKKMPRLFSAFHLNIGVVSIIIQLLYYLFIHRRPIFQLSYNYFKFTIFKPCSCKYSIILGRASITASDSWKSIIDPDTSELLI